jgi:Kinesin motor domain
MVRSSSRNDSFSHQSSQRCIRDSFNEDEDDRNNNENVGDGDGILILSLKELFMKVRGEQAELQKVYMIRCCYFEIYNDSIYDLLIENPKDMASSEPL